MLDLQESDQRHEVVAEPTVTLWGATASPDRLAGSSRTSAYVCGAARRLRDPDLDDLVEQLDRSSVADADAVDYIAIAFHRAGAAGVLVVRGTAARVIGHPPAGDTWTIALRIDGVRDVAVVALEHGGISVPADPNTAIGRLLCTVGRDARKAEDGGRAIAAGHPLEAEVAAVLTEGDGVRSTAGLRVHSAAGAPPVVVQTRTTA
ncbi:MAG: hypothetical protein QOJ09_952 [Actinomycetota bacterium]|nr:hypothetical protein [Actinomycetota bacterium]